MSINIEVFIPLLGIYEVDGWFKYRNFVHIHNLDDLNEISKLCIATMVVIDCMFDYLMFVAFSQILCFSDRSSLILLLAVFPIIKPLAKFIIIKNLYQIPIFHWGQRFRIKWITEGNRNF